MSATSRFRQPAPINPVEGGSIPSFSIAIAAYQAAATVGEAVASALAQTRPAREVIVCDDGSTDALGDALDPYRDRIRIIRKTNGGGASALNHAARIADGDFVAILDADDVYDERRIEALGDLAATRPDLDILTTDAYLEVDGDIRGRFTSGTPFVTGDQRAAILRSCFIVAPAVRRGRVLAAGGWDESLRIGYDWDCWLRLILDGARAGLVDEPLMFYRLHAESLTSNRVESFRARVQLLEKALDHPSLSRRERRILRASIGWQRSRVVPELDEALAAEGRLGTLAWRIAQCRGLLARARFGALARAARSQCGRRE